MSKNNKSNFTDEEFIKIVQGCQTMAYASKKLGMVYTSFIRRAKKLGCYKPNPGSKGVKRPNISRYKYPIKEILEGKHPDYQTYKLHIRLIKEGYFEDKCSICGWDKKPKGAEFTPCELDHINGNPTDHRLENLRLICPNCHSLTETYRFRRGKTNELQGRKLLEESEANSAKTKGDCLAHVNAELNQN